MLKHYLIYFACLFMLVDCASCEQYQTNQRAAETPALGTQLPVVITYIANEAVLISSGDKKVLIDALHKPYRPAYLSTPPDIESNIIKGRAVIDDVTKPKALVVVHVSPSESNVVVRAARRFYESASVFTRPLQSVKFE